MNEPLNILFMTSEPFPLGMAATNRILALARGCVESGATVKVLCMRTVEVQDREIRNAEACGVFNGVEFEYTTGTTMRGATFMGRRWLQIRSVLRAAAIIRKAGKSPGHAVVMQYLHPPRFMLMYYLIARLYGVKYVRDQVEYPFVYFRRSAHDSMFTRVASAFTFKLYDGLFAITRTLEEHVRPQMRRNAKLMRVPMTVETGRFIDQHTDPPDPGDYIAYCGYLHGDKDGVPILITAFSQIASRFPGLKLYVLGDGVGQSDITMLQDLAGKLGVAERVVFTGRVVRDSMPMYLCNAKILALARPTGLQSDGGFPSKLGEYLATGRPVVVTSVGEIPEYLVDGETAFLAAPDSPEAFAERLEYVLLHPEIANNVGARGREVAVTQFDYHAQGARIVKFLREVAAQ